MLDGNFCLATMQEPAYAHVDTSKLATGPTSLQFSIASQRRIDDEAPNSHGARAGKSLSGFYTSTRANHSLKHLAAQINHIRLHRRMIRTLPNSGSSESPVHLS